MNTRAPHTADLFADTPAAPGALGCGVEIAATIADAIERSGKTREALVASMNWHAGESKMSVNMLNNYTSVDHPHEISLRRAMAFDAAVGHDVLLGLYTAKRGGRLVVDADDAALLEWARLHHQERELAERRRALEASLKLRGRA